MLEVFLVLIGQLLYCCTVQELDECWLIEEHRSGILGAAGTGGKKGFHEARSAYPKGSSGNKKT